MKKVILISGKARSGKNQFAEYLQKELEYYGLKVSQDLFAKTLKDWCKEDFKGLVYILESFAEQIKAKIALFTDTREHMLNPNIIQELENNIDRIKIKDYNWYEDKTPITRTLLQAYGTDIFRKRVDDNWWVQQMKKRVLTTDSDVIIITDARFPNEITDMIDNNYEIITIRIKRTINTTEQMNLHPSETSLDNWKEWNYIIENNGSLEDLKKSAKTVSQDLNENENELIGLFTRQSKENLQWVNSLTS